MVELFGNGGKKKNQTVAVVDKSRPVPSPGDHKPDYYGDHAHEEPGFDLDHSRFETAMQPPPKQELNADKIDRIAELIRGLTYGEMLKLASLIRAADAKKMINEDEVFADVLHKFAEAQTDHHD